MWSLCWLREGQDSLPCLRPSSLIHDRVDRRQTGRTQREGIRASRRAYPDQMTKQFPPLGPRGQPRITVRSRGHNVSPPPQDDEMGRVPRVYGRRSWPGMASHPAEAGGSRGTGGGPWTGITSAGSVSGLELRRACFFSVCLHQPLGNILPFGGSFISKWLGNWPQLGWWRGTYRLPWDRGGQNG